MKNLLVLSLSFLSLGSPLSAFAEQQLFYCPSSITCDTTTCKPTSSQDLWANNADLPPGTKPGEYKFVHAEWYANSSMNQSFCNYYDGTNHGIMITAKSQLYYDYLAKKNYWFPPTFNNSASCYPNNLGNPAGCPFTKDYPWIPKYLETL